MNLERKATASTYLFVGSVVLLLFAMIAWAISSIFRKVTVSLLMYTTFGLMVLVIISFMVSEKYDKEVIKERMLIRKSRIMVPDLLTSNSEDAEKKKLLEKTEPLPTVDVEYELERLAKKLEET